MSHMSECLRSTWIETSPCGNFAAKCSPPDVSPLNVWIQVGAYVWVQERLMDSVRLIPRDCRYILIAISEIFASITGLEYAFTKAPKNMRSLVMSLYLFMSAISSAIGEAFVCKPISICIPIDSLWHVLLCRLKALSADPLLVWNYGVMGILAFVTGWIFWWSTKDLDADEDGLNSLAEGHFGLSSPDKREKIWS